VYGPIPKDDKAIAILTRSILGLSSISLRHRGPCTHVKEKRSVRLVEERRDGKIAFDPDS